MRNLRNLIIVISIVGIFFIVGYTIRGSFIIQADPLNTSVTVNNSVPTFTTNPYEMVASTTANPTNAGQTVTFSATATDPNSDDYFLAVCTTNAVTSGGVAAPTCDVGDWCISSITTSDNPASCSYDTLTGDAESNDWYAFICDSISGGGCTSFASGANDNESPFFVNHVPTFTSVLDTATNPGGSVTFTTVSSDADIVPVSDTVKLVICDDIVGATYAGCTNAGAELCASIDEASNASCTWNGVPSVIAHGDYSYYAYIFDNHGVGAASNYIAGTYTINNVDPVVSGVIVAQGAEQVTASLSEGITTAFTITGTVQDSNSCQDVNSVVTSMYVSDIAYSACDIGGESDDNHCYAAYSCTWDSVCLITEDVKTFTCTIPVGHHADSTTGTGVATDSPFWDYMWETTVIADDGTGQGTDTDTIEIAQTVGIAITATVNYGSMLAGGNTGSTNQTTLVESSGNVGIDLKFEGTDMCDVGCINVSNQKYMYDVVSFDWSIEGSTLASTGNGLVEEFNLFKTLDTLNKEDKTVFWGIGIPINTDPGTYTGVNTLIASVGQSAQWQ